MASESGGFNPANFYVGVVDFFAIILPGAILVFLASSTPLLKSYVTEQGFKANFLSDIPGIKLIGFIVASYMIGHFLAAFGHGVMIPLFEEFYASRFTKSLRKLAGRAKEKISGILDADASCDEQYRWSLAYLSLYSPQSATRLDSREADCRFFRNLTPAILLSLPLIDSMSTRSLVGPMFELFLILVFFGYMAFRTDLNSLFPVAPKGLFARASKSIFLMFLLSLAPFLLSTVQIRKCGGHSYVLVNLGLYILALIAGSRYIALQCKSMSSTYELLVVFFSKLPEAIAPGEATD